MAEYQVNVSRDGEWWGFELPELVSTTPHGVNITAMGQSRALGQVERDARDVAALWLDADPASIEVKVRYPLPGDVSDALSAAQALDAEAKAAAAEAAALRRSAATSLVAGGFSQQEVGVVLGLSRQRVHQLVRQP